MNFFIFLRKIKNSILTPRYEKFYKRANFKIENEKRKNILEKILYKLFWFLPNTDSHVYWCNQKENERCGLNKYIKNDIYINLLVKEINKRSNNKKIKILDLCCNVGRSLNSLKKLGYINLYGVDINKLAIKKMKKVFKKLKKAKVVHSSAESFLLNSKDNFYDILFSSGASVELIPSTFDLIKEISRVTKSFVILFINENGHAYPRFWRYEFRKNNMSLIFNKKYESNTLLVFKKNNQNER